MSDLSFTSYSFTEKLRRGYLGTDCHHVGISHDRKRHRVEINVRLTKLKLVIFTISWYGWKP